MDKKILIFGLLSLVLTLVPLGANAQDNFYQLEDGSYIHYSGLVPCGKQVWLSDSLENQNYSAVHMPCQFCHLFVMLSAIISFLLTSLVPILAVILLVAGGIMYYLSLGNPEKLSKANKMLQGTIIGLVIIYGAWMIVGLLLTVIGVADWTGLEDGWYTIDCPIRADFATLDDVIVLEVAKEGPGKVISISPEGLIDCGERCSVYAKAGQIITLQAIGDEGAPFVKWGGDCSGTGNCTLKMDQSRIAIAVFQPENYSLRVKLTGCPSQVTTNPEGINCGFDISKSNNPFDYPLDECQSEFPQGKRVCFTVKSLPGACGIINWGQIKLEGGMRCIEMDADKSVVIDVGFRN